MEVIVRLPVTVVKQGLTPGAAAWVPLPGLIVFARPEYITIRLLAHELQHVRQWAYEGWTFPLKYAWAWARAGFSYRDNPYEIEARRAEADTDMLLWASDVQAGVS